LFRVSDFYYCYEDDAKKVSDITGLTLSKGIDGYLFACFPFHGLDTYLPMIVRAGERVAICDRIE
jgi:DNA mismatch repair protein MutS